MKYTKTLMLGAVALSGAFLAAPNVHATDLTGKLNLSDSNGLWKLSQTYDKDNDVNELHVAVTINEGLIKTVLAQRPGNATSKASLSQFVVGLEPETMKGKTVKKSYYWANKEYNISNGQLKTLLDEAVKNESATTTTGFWPTAIAVKYYDSSSKKWETPSPKDSDGRYVNTGDGTKSIGENLVEYLGIDSEEELVYGENYLFGIYDSWDMGLIWQDAASENAAPNEYIRISYEAIFPVTVTTDTGIYAYYPTLKQAIESGSKSITINNDLEVNDELTLASGTTLTVANNATLSFGENGKLTADKGDIIVESGSKIEGEDKIVYNKYEARVAASENGKISLDGGAFTGGDAVTVTITPDDGYVLDTLRYDVAEDSYVEITKISEDGKTATFEMPNGIVNVYATFKAKSFNIVRATSGDDGSYKVSESASYKSTVTVSDIAAAKGYKFSKIVVTGRDSKQEIAVSYNKEKQSATFEMPAEDVFVEVIFDEVAAVANEDAAAEIISDTLLELAKTSKELAAIMETGAEVTADIVTSQLGEKDVAKETVTAFAKAAEESNKDMKILNYFDISINIMADGMDTGLNIHELKKLVTFLVDAPEDLPEVAKGMKRVFYVIRMHEGKTEILDAKYNEKTSTIEFESDKFSTYALAYVDVSAATIADTAGSFVETSAKSFAIFTVLISAAVVVAKALQKAYKKLNF